MLHLWYSMKNVSLASSKPSFPFRHFSDYDIKGNISAVWTFHVKHKLKCENAFGSRGSLLYICVQSYANTGWAKGETQPLVSPLRRKRKYIMMCYNRRLVTNRMIIYFPFWFRVQKSWMMNFFHKELFKSAGDRQGECGNVGSFHYHSTLAVWNNHVCFGLFALSPFMSMLASSGKIMGLHCYATILWNSISLLCVYLIFPNFFF